MNDSYVSVVAPVELLNRPTTSIQCSPKTAVGIEFRSVFMSSAIDPLVVVFFIETIAVLPDVQHIEIKLYLIWCNFATFNAVKMQRNVCLVSICFYTEFTS